MNREPWADDSASLGDVPAFGAAQEPGAPGSTFPGRQRVEPQRARRTQTTRACVDITVQLGRVQIILWLVVGGLISLNFLLSSTAALQLLPYAVTRFFGANDKDGFLTGAKCTLLLLSTLLMFACWAAARRGGDPSARGWQLLGMVAGFAFADETTFLHASLAEMLRDRYHFSGLLRYAWAILYLPAAIVVAMVLVRDLRRMAPAVRRRMLPGGAAYALGAVVLEPVRAALAEAHGSNSLSFDVAAAVSDAVELAGLTLVVCALLIAVGRLAGTFTFVLTDPEPLRRSLAGPGEAPERVSEPADPGATGGPGRH